MIRFGIKYENLIKANKEHPIDEAYKLILAIKDPWESLDSIIDFVRRWDFRVPIRNNENKIKEFLLGVKTEFVALEKFNIEDLDFNSQNINYIKYIFNKLQEIGLQGPKRKVRLGSTGASKLMHGINPNLFVMWDKGICDYYGCYPNATGYIHFMELMQQEIREILKERGKEKIIKETGVSLPKLLDAYNWSHYSTSRSMGNK